MKTACQALIATALLFASSACSDDGEPPDAGADAQVLPGDAGPGADGGAADTGPGPDAGPAECDLAANVAKRNALLAAQPTFGTRSKAVLTQTITFASEAGDPGVRCPVELRFKDLQANGSVEAYENWTLTPEARAADLLGRMSPEQKMGLMVHGTATDIPTTSSAAVSAALQAMINDGHLRFARTTAASAQPNPRAAWANNVQALCEASPLGIPFVLSLEPSHSIGNGRLKARGFSQWPHELGLAALNDPALVENFGQIAATEYRAIGVRMALSPSADLFTEPRWNGGQFTFGEDSAGAAAMVAAYVRGFQGAALGRDSVACVVKHFPGAGAATDGWDARLEKGQYLAFPGDNLDAHLFVFQKALEAGAAGVMPGYGILQTGSWSALGGLLDGTTLEQVGAPYNQTLLTTVLRGHYDFSGLVVAPSSALDRPWGVDVLSESQRVAKAIGAGVDQLAGLDAADPIAAARTAGLVTDAQLDASAGRALRLMFRLGLFEDPYVDETKAAQRCNTDAAYQAGLKALNGAMVLLVNAPKPAGWLNGSGDGTQTGDPGNAGNGTMKVLPAPPGAPYIAAGCSYFILGANFDLDYVRSVSTGYGELTNDANIIDGVPVSTEAQRIARSDYVFVRVNAPFTTDPDSGALNLPKESLEYAGNDPTWLDEVRKARAAIDALPGSQTQIVVGVDSGRPSVISEILDVGVSAVYVEWIGVDNSIVDDKVFLDVAFGIVDGRGKLAAGLPLSDAAVQNPALQKADLPGDGQHPTFVRGFGLPTNKF